MQLVGPRERESSNRNCFCHKLNSGQWKSETTVLGWLDQTPQNPFLNSVAFIANQKTLLETRTGALMEEEGHAPVEVRSAADGTRVYVFVFEKNFGDHRKRYTGRNFAVFR